MLFFIGSGIFISIVLLVEGAHYTYKNLLGAEARRIRRRLRNASAGGYGYADVDILRRDMMSEIPWFNKLLLNIPLFRRLDHLLKQANIQRPLSIFILLSIILFFFGFLLGKSLSWGNLLSFFAGAGMGILPLFHACSKKRSRMHKFQTQLPEALELIARSLRAGHAFSSGLKITADEFDDPVGTEFAKTLSETNFGISVTEALKNLSVRVDCADLKYFVVSVIIQQETGGNLAEILESASYLIRERFKLEGTIRALSAEGKISAVVLIVLPIVLAFVLYLLNPSYISFLITESLGKKMVVLASFLMILGALTIRKMIKIKV